MSTEVFSNDEGTLFSHAHKAMNDIMNDNRSC